MSSSGDEYIHCQEQNCRVMSTRVLKYTTVLWLTGLSGAGKSTIANELKKQLSDVGFRGGRSTTVSANDTGADHSVHYEVNSRKGNRVFVIKHIDTGKCVARPGSKRSYTNDLEEACVYRTREDAKKELCEGSEDIVELARLFARLHPTR